MFIGRCNEKNILVFVFIPAAFLIEAQEISDTLSADSYEESFNKAVKYFYDGNLDKKMFLIIGHYFGFEKAFCENAAEHMHHHH